MMLILKEKILVYTITIYHAWDIREQAPGSCGLDIQNPQKAGYSDFSLCNPSPSTGAWGSEETPEPCGLPGLADTVMNKPQTRQKRTDT